MGFSLSVFVTWLDDHHHLVTSLSHRPVPYLIHYRGRTAPIIFRIALVTVSAKLVTANLLKRIGLQSKALDNGHDLCVFLHLVSVHIITIQ